MLIVKGNISETLKEDPKQSLHLLDLFEVGLVLVMVVTDPFYNEKELSTFENRSFLT